MEKQISILEVIQLFIRRWWILLIGAVAGMFLFGFYTSFFVTPMYVSTGALYTENSTGTTDADVNDVNLNTIMVRKELVQTYAEVLTSNVFLKKVAAECGLDYSYSQIRGMLSMSAKNETEILVIRVRSANPQHSYIIAQKIVDLASEQISSVVSGGGVKILDEPEYAKAPSSPNMKTNVTMGGMLGVLLSAAIVFLIDFTDNKIKNAEQLTKLFISPVLGEIPYFSSETKKNRMKLQKSA